MSRLSPASLVAATLLAICTVIQAEPTTSKLDDLGQRVEVPRPENLVAAADWGSKPDAIDEARRHTPQRVMMHHAGVLWTTDRDPVTFIRNMQSWGKRRPQIEQPPRNTYWPDLPYHFLIAPDGTIYEGRSLEFEPESNTKYDLAGFVGVELMGNFEAQRPSPEQVESAVRLVAWLLSEYEMPLTAITTHARVAKGQTTCPGRDFARYFEGETAEFHQWVGQVLQGKSPTIDLGDPLKDGPTELITETKRKSE